MTRLVLLILGLCTMTNSITTAATNPLLEEWSTPFQVPPFEEINVDHYLPAFEQAMKAQTEAVEAIVDNTDEPSFENTIEALEYSGEVLSRVSQVFYPIRSAHTNDAIQAVAQKVAPKLSRHRDNIALNSELFDRIKAVHANKEQLDLDVEQFKLLEETYTSFVRNGANLSDKDKQTLRTINEKLATLTLTFGENVLAETNDYKLVINDNKDLAGLPDWLIEQAATTAEEEGLGNAWVFTLHKPSWIPFLQYSSKRDLREKLYQAWMHIGDNDNEHDNKAVIAEIVALRAKRANLLGYGTHADYVLDRNMAKTADNVNELLFQLWQPALNRAKAEAYDMQKMIEQQSDQFDLQSWDWWYYSEKIRQEKYALSDDILKPYFELENVKNGVFTVVNNLYGLEFVELTDVPVYHPDVDVYQVKDADGSHLALLYMDFYTRSSKRSGAWMTSFREQYRKNGELVPPIISIVMNFSKPTKELPSLLTLDNVLTFFHEFGHALHGMLSDCTYPGLSGTDVRRDFVELPSQIMENWAVHPQVIPTYAKHYKTGEPIPAELVAKIDKSSKFNQGFKTVEYLAASFLDLSYHTRSETTEIEDVDAFEVEAMNDIGLIDEIIPRYRSTYFQHIFAGGYSSGYYSYIWAEVLDADAFEAFKETGLFDRETANAFRKHILEKGGTEEPMTLYERFRGRQPEILPLLKRRGLL